VFPRSDSSPGALLGHLLDHLDATIDASLVSRPDFFFEPGWNAPSVHLLSLDPAPHAKLIGRREHPGDPSNAMLALIFALSFFISGFSARACYYTAHWLYRPPSSAFLQVYFCLVVVLEFLRVVPVRSKIMESYSPAKLRT
jgi:hypothetical protein